MDHVKSEFTADDGGAAPAINLQTFDGFRSHPWVDDLARGFRNDSVLAKYALVKLVDDLKEIDKSHREENRGALFTTVEGRVKTEGSFFRKLYGIWRDKGRALGFTPNNLNELYLSISDILGARFACPYWDDVIFAINNVVRPALAHRGYAVDLHGDPRYGDKNYLDTGSEAGYRSYHFFIMVPTRVDIYGDVKQCLCEIQARTELQHVWAVKSHDLLYKPDTGLDLTDQLIVDDMKQASDHLRAIDHHFVSIRERLRRLREVADHA